MVSSSDDSAPPPSILGVVYSNFLTGHCVVDLFHLWPLVTPVQASQSSKRDIRGRNIASEAQSLLGSSRNSFDGLESH